MSMLSRTGAKLPAELTDVCDGLLMPLSLSLPDVEGLPIVFANRPFEYMTGADAWDIVGRNLSMLDGPLTDVSLAHELDIAMAQHQRESGCKISYRTDGIPFYHLMAFQTLELPDRNLLAIACHCAFQPVVEEKSMSRTVDTLDDAWRGIRRHHRNTLKALAENDIFRLEAISMRFDAVFARAQNALIKNMTSGFSSFLKYSTPMPSYRTAFENTPNGKDNMSRYDEIVNLGPLSKP